MSETDRPAGATLASGPIEANFLPGLGMIGL